MEIVKKFANMAAMLSQNVFETIHRWCVSNFPTTIFIESSKHMQVSRQKLCKVSSYKLFATNRQAWSFKSQGKFMFVCLLYSTFKPKRFPETHLPMRNYKFISDEWHLSHTERHSCMFLHDIFLRPGRNNKHTQRVIWVNNSKIEFNLTRKWWLCVFSTDSCAPSSKWRSLQLF